MKPFGDHIKHKTIKMWCCKGGKCDPSEAYTSLVRHGVKPKLSL